MSAVRSLQRSEGDVSNLKKYIHSLSEKRKLTSAGCQIQI